MTLRDLLVISGLCLLTEDADEAVRLALAEEVVRLFGEDAFERLEAIEASNEESEEVMLQILRSLAVDQELLDVKAGIPARDAEIAALRKQIETLQARLQSPVNVHSNMCRGIIAPITFDMLAHMLGDDAKQEWIAAQTQPLDIRPLEITDGMALAFHHAITDGSIGQQDVDEIKTGLRAAFVNVVDSLSRRDQAQQPVSGADGLPIELRGISEAIRNGDGVWRSCSGCHELNEGMATGPFSKTFKCHLGVGCAECGGIGAIWDTTDYDAMADFMAVEYQQRTENTEPAGQDQGDSWSGWACQYPSKLPRLYGAKDIAVANHHPEEGDRLIFLTAQQDAAQLIEPSGNAGELYKSFESWRKSELPWTSPATTGMGFAWDAWRARAALAQQDADKVDAALAEMVHAMFRSGNSVPVTRTTIDRKQYDAAIDAARKEQA